MFTVFYAVAPIFSLIFVGFALRRFDFPGQGFWPTSEKLTYYILLPALLIRGLSGKELHPDSVPMVAAVLCAVLLVTLGTRLLWPFLRIDGPAYTSLFQGTFRPNMYIAMSLAAALLGPEWLTLSAMVLLFLIPVINILCVVTLLRHGIGGGGGGITLIKSLVTNPLIVASLTGLALNVLQWPLPRIISDLMGILGNGALPMGLMAAGAGLRLQKVSGGRRSLFVASSLHLLVLPFLAAFLAQWWGADSLAQLTAIIYTAAPASVSSFILARQMGGDHQLMAQIITFQTVLSMLTLPCILFVMG